MECESSETSGGPRVPPPAKKKQTTTLRSAASAKTTSSKLCKTPGGGIAKTLDFSGQRTTVAVPPRVRVLKVLDLLALLPRDVFFINWSTNLPSPTVVRHICFTCLSYGCMYARSLCFNMDAASCCDGALLGVLPEVADVPVPPGGWLTYMSSAMYMCTQ